MAVSEQDVRHIADLARLGLTPERLASLVVELNGILAHMSTLEQVDTSGVAALGTTHAAMPLRADGLVQIPLHRAREDFAPAMQDGFFLVPRLATHADAGDDE